MGKASVMGQWGVWLAAVLVAVALACPTLAWADGASGTAASAAPISVVGGSSIQAAVEITPGGQYTDSAGLTQGTAEKWYKVVLGKPGKFGLSFAGTYAEKGSWSVSLRDASNREIASHSCNASKFLSGKAETCVVTGLPSGVYYIQVTGSQDLLGLVTEEGGYTLLPTFAPSDAWEAEPNDGFSSANKMTLGKAVAGTLLGASDQDCFRFTLSKAGKLSVSLLGTAADSGYWRVTVLDAAGNEVGYNLCQATGFFSGKAQTCVVTGLGAGTYFIRVSGPSTPGGAAYVQNKEYRLTAKVASASGWEREFNDTPDTATALALGGSVSGTVRPAGKSDDDWYRVKLSKAGTFALTFKGAYSASGFWTTYLYKASDTSASIASATYYATTKGAKRLVAKSLKAGTYYVKVEGGSVVQNLAYTLSAKTLASLSSATVSSIGAKAYTGKAITPAPTVKLSGKTLKKGTDYTLKYQKNVKVGTASITITGKGNYTGTKKATFKIVKAANPMKASSVAKTVKVSKTKKASAELSGAVRVSGAKGTVTYAKVAQGSAKQLTVRKSSGKVTLAKGTPKGTYKLKVKVTAKGNSGYKAASKTVTVTVKVK